MASTGVFRRPEHRDTEHKAARCSGVSRHVFRKDAVIDCIFAEVTPRTPRTHIFEDGMEGSGRSRCRRNARLAYLRVTVNARGRPSCRAPRPRAGSARHAENAWFGWSYDSLTGPSQRPPSPRGVRTVAGQTFCEKKSGLVLSGVLAFAHRATPNERVRTESVSLVLVFRFRHKGRLTP